VTTHPQVQPDPAFGLLELYDAALPQVYGYLLGRCGDVGLAEELTAESFLAAVHAVRKPGPPKPSPALARAGCAGVGQGWRGYGWRVSRSQVWVPIWTASQGLPSGGV
jgi:RNA polymerase sigma-70 factor (ECF subfamily)